MADIRNDIIELQEKVFGERRGISLDTPPQSSGDVDFVDWGSGQGDLMVNTWPLTSVPVTVTKAQQENHQTWLFSSLIKDIGGQRAKM